MEAIDIMYFLEQEDIKAGDTVRILYKIMFAEYISGEIAHNELFSGGRSVELGGLTVALREAGPYLMLYTHLGLTGAQVKYIEHVEVEHRKKGLTDRQ